MVSPTISFARIISVLRSIKLILPNALSESGFAVVAGYFSFTSMIIFTILESTLVFAIGIHSFPTFTVNGKHLIQGMQPIGVFLQAFKEAAKQ